jgi:DNA-binding response OmpR family regulator
MEAILQPMTASSLAGKNLLIVEDEVFIALNLEQLLSEDGAEIRHARTCAEATRLLETARFDGAILDVHLDDGSTYAVADELRRRQTPFIFLSGYLTVREGYADVPFLAKPVTANSLRQGILDLFGNTGS